MVKKRFWDLCFPGILVSLFALAACSVDLLGLFGSNDLDIRLADRNTFHFLTEEDRNLSLGDTYSFIVLTDTHIENGDARDFEALKQAVDPSVAFVVVLGDVTQSGKGEDVQKFIDGAKTLGVPCYPVLGNHDIYFNNWHNWRDRIGSSSYRINGSTATLFILDTANAFYGDDQLKWLARELKTAGDRVFLFTHTNIFVESLADLQQHTDVRERARVMSVLEGRCDGMFTGHAHKRIIKNAGGVQYISIEDFKTNKTYCRVQVSPGGIQYRFEKLF
jgi:predicted phosphodiesterase